MRTITPSEWRGEQLHVDVGLAAREALEEAGRGELDQVGEAGVVLGQQGEVVALVLGLLLDRLAVVDEVGLEPDDRLDPVLLAGLVEVDGAVHHAVVGEPQRRLPELGGARRHRVDLAGAVEQRVLAVGVEMDGGRACSRGPAIMPSRPDGTGPRSARLPRSFRAGQLATAQRAASAQTQALAPESAQISAAIGPVRPSRRSGARPGRRRAPRSRAGSGRRRRRRCEGLTAP